MIETIARCWSIVRCGSLSSGSCKPALDDAIVTSVVLQVRPADEILPRRRTANPNEPVEGSAQSSHPGRTSPVSYANTTS